jgi:hypothetical protein
MLFRRQTTIHKLKHKATVLVFSIITMLRLGEEN